MRRSLAGVTLGFILTMTSGTVIAQDCPELVGRSPEGASFDVVTDGSTAYLANGASLTVVDLSIPTSPSIVGSVELPFYIRYLAYSDGRVFATTRAHLHVIDVRGADPPLEIGRLAFKGFQLDADGDLLCIETEDGLSIFDVSTPASPNLVSTVQPLGIWDVKVVGHYAYLSGDGLQIYDLSDPTTPKLVGQFDTLVTSSLDVVGDIAYLADSYGLVVVDVSDPTAPIQLGNLASVLGGDVAVHGDLAFLRAWPEAMHVIDVSDPAHPQLAGTAARPPGERWSWGRVAAIANHGLYADLEYGLRVIDATDASEPVVAAGANTPGLIKHAVHSNGVLFLAASDQGLRSVDVADPLDPKELMSLDLGGTVEAVDVEGDLAVAVGWLFKVVDVSDPSSPVVLGEIPGMTGGRSVEMVDDLAYVADYETGLHIVDISTPSVPIEIGHLNPGGYEWRQVVVSGQHVFMPRSGGIEVISVEDPTHPVSVTSIPGSVSTVATYKSSLLVGSSPGLRIFDIQYPSYPVEITQYTTTGWVLDIGISGSVAYLGIQGPGPHIGSVEIVNIGDLDSPVTMGQYVGASAPAPGFVFDRQMAYFFKRYSGFDTFTLCLGPLFADGFETGDTSEWASAQP